MTELPPGRQMMDMLAGYWTTQALYAAAKHNLADLVEKEPRTAQDLAQATATHAPSLYRLLRFLAGKGVFAEDAQGRFGLTPLAECLLDRPGSQKAVALMSGEEHYVAWGELLYSLQTGKTGFEKVYGKPVFDYLSEHAEQAKIFDAAMQGIHGPETEAMIGAYDFSDIGVLMDVGGGNGSTLLAVLKRYPLLRGVLFDLPGVIARARENIVQAKLGARCSALEGSFFQAVPAGADAYMMRHIIHDWTDEQCLTILGHMRKVAKDSTRLLVVETVVPPGNDPHFVKGLDLNMLVLPGGKERTEEEYRRLYQAAGFRLSRIVPTKAGVDFIEGVPA